MTEKITPQMKQFLIEFAELIQHHGIGIEVTEGGTDWNSYANGIEFTQNGTWDGEGNVVIPWSFFVTKNKFIDTDFIDEVNKLEVE